MASVVLTVLSVGLSLLFLSTVIQDYHFLYFWCIDDCEVAGMYSFFVLLTGYTPRRRLLAKLNTQDMPQPNQGHRLPRYGLKTE